MYKYYIYRYEFPKEGTAFVVTKNIDIVYIGLSSAMEITEKLFRICARRQAEIEKEKGWYTTGCR